MQNAQTQAAAQTSLGNIYGSTANTLGSLGYGYLSNQNNTSGSNGIINTPYTGAVTGPDYSQPVGNLISTAD
jgi:hypothetical protein